MMLELMAKEITKKKAAPKAKKADVATVSTETTASTTSKSLIKHYKKAEKAENATDFAIIMTGGKQYVVHVGDLLKIEKMLGEYKEGDTISFDNVLLSNTGTTTTVGAPFTGTKVTSKLVKIGRHAKVTIIKYKQKSRYFKKNGHRQPFFQVQIEKLA